MADLKLYDTTLRDGSQGEGISFSVTDKLRIARELAMLGIHYIEGGWPGSNPKDMEFFLKVSRQLLEGSCLVAFSMTRRPGLKADRDPNLSALLKSRVKHVAIVGKTWNLHISDVLKVSLEDNLEMIKDTVGFSPQKGLRYSLMRSIFLMPTVLIKTTLCAAWIPPARQGQRQLFYAIPTAGRLPRKSRG